MIEVRALATFARFAPEQTPAVLDVDPERFAFTMEDLSDLAVLRGALTRGARFGDTSSQVGALIGRVTFATSVAGASAAERATLLAASVNPVLAEVTEQYLLSEPFLEHEHNRAHPALAAEVAELRADPAVRTEVSALRAAFATRAEALVHGDLHSGSVMVGERDGAPVVRVIDPRVRRRRADRPGPGPVPGQRAHRGGPRRGAWATASGRPSTPGRPGSSGRRSPRPGTPAGPTGSTASSTTAGCPATWPRCGTTRSGSRRWRWSAGSPATPTPRTWRRCPIPARRAPGAARRRGRCCSTARRCAAPVGNRRRGGRGAGDGTGRGRPATQPSRLRSAGGGPRGLGRPGRGGDRVLRRGPRRPGRPGGARQGVRAAHRGHGIPNAVDTRFGIASGTKGLTALAVMSLVEEGRLDLDTTARSVLGEDLPLIDDDVTVEHLLAHRSGIGDYFDEDAVESMTDYVMPVPVHRLATTADYLAVLDGHPQKFAPGERFAYNNGGFVVLALIAERVSGMPFPELVRTRVCEPAGMRDTEFLRSDEPARARGARLPRRRGPADQRPASAGPRQRGRRRVHHGGGRPRPLVGPVRRPGRAGGPGRGDGAPPAATCRRSRCATGWGSGCTRRATR